MADDDKPTEEASKSTCITKDKVRDNVLIPKEDTTIDLTNDDDEDLPEYSGTTTTSTKAGETISMAEKDKRKIAHGEHTSLSTKNRSTGRHPMHYMQTPSSYRSRLDKARKNINYKLTRKMPVTLHIGGRLQQFPSSSTFSENGRFPAQTSTIPAASQGQMHVNNGHEHLAPGHTNFHRHFMEHPSEKSVLGAIFINNLLQQSIMEYQKIRAPTYPHLTQPYRLGAHNNMATFGIPATHYHAALLCPAHKSSGVTNLRAYTNNPAMTKSVTSTFTVSSSKATASAPHHDKRINYSSRKDEDSHHIPCVYQTVEMQRADAILKPIHGRFASSASRTSATSTQSNLESLRCGVKKKILVPPREIRPKRNITSTQSSSIVITEKSTSSSQSLSAFPNTIVEGSKKDSPSSSNATDLSKKGHSSVCSTPVTSTGHSFMIKTSTLPSASKTSKRSVTFAEDIDEAPRSKLRKCQHYLRRQRMNDCDRNIRAVLRSACRKRSMENWGKSVSTEMQTSTNSPCMSTSKNNSVSLLASMQMSPLSATTNLQQDVKCYRCQSVTHPNAVLAMIRICTSCKGNYTIACNNISSGACVISLNNVECPKCWNANACYCGEPFSDRYIGGAESYH